MKFYKCLVCGKVINSNEKMECCGKEMEELIPNSTEASLEKHVPNYEIMGDKVKVSVNHPMTSEHNIEWIALVDGEDVLIEDTSKLEEASVVFPYKKGSKIYVYCNLHGLWVKDVD